MRRHLLMAYLVICTQSAWAQNKPVLCENKSDCPGWMAHLQTSTGGHCSSFLLKPDVIATNRHCMPDDVQTTKDSCKGKITFHFPETDKYPFETRDCAEVLDISEKFGDAFIPLDIAILKLVKPVEREVVKLVQTGVADKAPLTIYKFDPTPDGGRIRKVDCVAVQKSVINPYFQHNQSPVVFFRGCPIIMGNSGSPLLVGKNQAAGIVSNLSWIMTPNSVREEIGTKVAGNGGHGTNFSCLNTFFLGYSKGYDPACKVKLDDKYTEDLKLKLLRESAEAQWKKAEKLMLERLGNQAEKLLMPFDSTVSGHRANEPGSDSKIVQSFELSPLCARWGSMMNDGGKTTKVVLNLQIPEVETTLDEHYRFVTNTHDRLQTIDLSWDFKQIQNDKFIQLGWKETGRYAKRKRFDLKRCPVRVRTR